MNAQMVCEKKKSVCQVDRIIENTNKIYVLSTFGMSFVQYLETRIKKTELF